MKNLIKAILPVGGAWWVVAASALLSLSAGVWLGNALQSRETYRVKTELADYKAEVARSVAEENVSVLKEMKGLQRTLGELGKQLRERQAIDEAFSNNLIKDLQNANGTSCELSPAVRAYVDRVRDRATGAGTD